MPAFDWFFKLFNRKKMMMMDQPLPSSSKKFDYFLNDPTTPELKVQLPLPMKPQGPGFDVRGINPDCECGGCLCIRAAGCQITLTRTLEYVQKLLKKPIEKWAATNNLFVNPEAGQQFNAFYDRGGLQFFFAQDPLTKKMVYCAEGTDTVAHEFYHAIIDALRPDLWDVHCLEIWAFHEGGADCGAMLHMLLHEEVIDYLMKETDGNLRKSNVVSRIAVELGNALYHVTRGEDGSVGGYLRDAVNTFVYVKPETLPNKAMVTDLANEPHSFSRVWSGAWYDALVGIYEQEVIDGTKKKIALIKARDAMGGYLLEAIRLAPANPRFYNAVANAMIAVSRMDNSKYTRIIRKAFQDRRIIPTEVPLLAPHHHRIELDDVLQVIKRGDEVIRHQVMTAIRTCKIHTIKSKHELGVAACNPLYGLKIDVPADEYFEFNITGSLVKYIGVVEEDVKEAANGCLDMLHNLGYVSSSPDTPFEIKDGKVVRTHFACGDGGIINNSSIPGSPEYGKPWKAKNNCGCGWCGKPKASGEKQQIKKGCVVRYNACRSAGIQVGQNARIKTC